MKWKRITRVAVGDIPRHGWKGRWDALVSFVTGKPVFIVRGIISFSTYIKTDKPIDISIWGANVEVGPLIIEDVQS